MSLDSLSEEQRTAVQSYLSVTGTSDISNAITSLERYDYDLEKAALEWLDAGSTSPQTSRSERSSRAYPAVQPRQNLFVYFLSWPIGFIFNILMKVLYAPTYLFTSYRSISGSDRANETRESDVDFNTYFEERYGEVHPPFIQTTYVKALEKAKKEVKFLIVFLLSDEHDATEDFCRLTMASSELASFVANKDILVWAGNVRHTEGYQVSLALQSNAYPFTGIISLRPRNTDSSGYKMSVVDRIEGPASAEEIMAKVDLQMARLTPQLASLKRERAEQEAARIIREQQDHAYQQSLLADREKARRLKEQQELEAQEKERQQKLLEKSALEARYRELFLEKLKSELGSEPSADEAEVSRFSFRLLNGERIIRRFRAKDRIRDLYLFCETLVPLNEMAPTTSTSQAITALPDHYDHQFCFRLLSPYPRRVYEPSSTSLRDASGLWPGANLMIELTDTE